MVVRPGMLAVRSPSGSRSMIDDGVAFAKESSFEDASEEAGTAGDEIVRHINSMIRTG